METKTKRTGKYGGKYALGGSLLLLALFLLLTPFRAEAAQAQSITLKESTLRLGIGETGTIVVDYSKTAGGYGDLGIVVSDPLVASASLQDAGNSQAVLTIHTEGFGSASVAVYVNSNPAIVAYAAVYSGLAEKGDVYTVTEGNSLITVYDDRLVYYNSTLTGKNGAVLAIKGMELERSKGVDCLQVTGDLLEKDSRLPGVNTFYACFYDAGGRLIKRQAVYSGDPISYNELTVSWYIPDGCTKIILE